MYSDCAHVLYGTFFGMIFNDGSQLMGLQCNDIILFHYYESEILTFLKTKYNLINPVFAVLLSCLEN
jgi:hypothetical protein